MGRAHSLLAEMKKLADAKTQLGELPVSRQGNIFHCPCPAHYIYRNTIFREFVYLQAVAGTAPLGTLFHQLRFRFLFRVRRLLSFFALMPDLAE